MDQGVAGPGAWPALGMGPREAAPSGLVWPARRGAADGPTQWQTRSGAFRSVGGGLWVPSAVDQTVDQRIVEAAARLPAYGAVTGWAALRWRGGRWFDGTAGGEWRLPVPLALGLGHTVRPHPALELSSEIIPPGTIGRVRGVRVTGPLWSCAYSMRKAETHDDAVVAFEMAAYDDMVSVAELAAFTEAHLWTRQGVQRIRDVLPDLEENSWSPAETIMRLIWIREFPRPQANRPVFDLAGRFVGTPDVLDPVAGVYGLYDGALHLAGSVRHGDVEKAAAYRQLGLEGVTMMAGDLAARGPFLSRLRQAYARAERRPASERGWMMEPPGWWVPTWTVARRRALSPYERSRLLTYRRAA